jgi:hypothetical protein
MKTAGRENPNHYRQPSTWRGRSKQILLDQVGCEARQIPAGGDVFFLDFFLYRTYQDFEHWSPTVALVTAIMTNGGDRSAQRVFPLDNWEVIPYIQKNFKTSTILESGTE